ncbi:MAG: hypothetical protein JHD22_08560, partial [Ilumatobacteraceae bacterium]|nr:hypothetical protein [Ilumatobacteraceae bacterium]
MKRQIRSSCASVVIVLFLSLVACSSSDSGAVTSGPEDTEVPDTSLPSESSLLAGSASASVLPTVNGTTDYLSEAPGWSDTVVNPTDIGVYVPMFDQGSVDVGNGSGDASWVHDDVQAAAIALDNNGERAIVVTVDVY